MGSAASRSRAGDAGPVPAIAQNTATELTADSENIAQLKSSLRHSQWRRCGRYRPPAAPTSITPSADWSARNTTIAAVQSITPALEPSSGVRSVIWFSANTWRSASASSEVAAGSGPRTPSATPIPAASAARPTQYTVTLWSRGSFMGFERSAGGGKASVRLTTP